MVDHKCSHNLNHSQHSLSVTMTSFNQAAHGLLWRKRRHREVETPAQGHTEPGPELHLGPAPLCVEVLTSQGKLGALLLGAGGVVYHIRIGAVVWSDREPSPRRRTKVEVGDGHVSMSAVGRCPADPGTANVYLVPLGDAGPHWDRDTTVTLLHVPICSVVFHFF